MNLVVRISIYLYSRLLRLYPPGFRHEFADEMLTVFTAALTDAQGRGRLSMAIWCSREFMGLLSTIVKEQLNALRQKEPDMSQMPTINHANDTSYASSESPRTVFAAILPFILIGLMSTLDGIGYHIQPSWSSSATNGYHIVSAITLIGLGVGLALGFPRWSFAYLGFVVLNFFWEEWIPLLVLTVATLLLARYLKSLNRLVKGIWLDWTLLSFALYAALTGLILLVTYDSKSYNQTLYLPLNLFLITLVITGGAVLYMVSQRPWLRVLALSAALILWMPVSALVASLDGHQEFGSPSTAFGWISYLLFLLVLLPGIPLLPGLASHVWLRLRPI